MSLLPTRGSRSCVSVSRPPLDSHHSSHPDLKKNNAGPKWRAQRSSKAVPSVLALRAVPPEGWRVTSEGLAPLRVPRSASTAKPAHAASPRAAAALAKALETSYWTLNVMIFAPHYSGAMTTHCSRIDDCAAGCRALSRRSRRSRHGLRVAGWMQQQR